MEYNEKDYDYDYNDYPEQEGGGGAAKGLKIAIGILLVVLAALSVLYFMRIQEIRSERQEAEKERDTLSMQLTGMMDELGNLRIDNDTLNVSLTQQRYMADSLMTRLKKERGWNITKIRAYERELGTLRTAMQGFVRTIDSLNKINQVLVGENLRYRNEMGSLRVRAEAAEEMSAELGSKVKRGSQIRVRETMLYAYNKKKQVDRAKQVERFIAEFILSANDLTPPGERTVYIRILTPDGEVLGSPDKGTFSFSGERYPYSAKRVVDYQGEDVPMSIYCDTAGLYAGQYTVMVFVDGLMAGRGELVLR